MALSRAAHTAADRTESSCCAGVVTTLGSASQISVRSGTRRAVEGDLGLAELGGGRLRSDGAVCKGVELHSNCVR